MAAENERLYRISYIPHNGDVGNSEWFDSADRLMGMLRISVIPAWIEDIDGNFIEGDFEAYLQVRVSWLIPPEEEPVQDPVVLASPEASVEGVEMIG